VPLVQLQLRLSGLVPALGDYMVIFRGEVVYAGCLSSSKAGLGKYEHVASGLNQELEGKGRVPQKVAKLLEAECLE
jgi:hypothetical protein